jgi:hypothetical protein
MSIHQQQINGIRIKKYLQSDNESDILIAFSLLNQLEISNTEKIIILNKNAYISTNNGSDIVIHHDRNHKMQRYFGFENDKFFYKTWVDVMEEYMQSEDKLQESLVFYGELICDIKTTKDATGIYNQIP